MLAATMACGVDETPAAPPGTSEPNGVAPPDVGGAPASTGSPDGGGGPAPDGGGPTKVGPPPGKVAAFIAQGQLGRTIVSCDDGKTWVGNHSWDVDGDPLLCGMKQTVACSTSDCSYSIGNQCVSTKCCTVGPDAPAAIAIGETSIVTAWGHGVAGPLRSATNGIDWTTRTIVPPSHVAFGGGRFVSVASAKTKWSSDGVTWMDGGDTGTKRGVRTIIHAPYAGGRFIGVASDGGVGEPANVNRDIVVSSDGGATWSLATLPASCAIGVGGAIAANDDLVIAGDEHGTVCTSKDGGATWAVTASNQSIVISTVKSGSRALWTGTAFAFWGAQSMATTLDGITWASVPMVGARALGGVARSDAGTFVSITGQYDGQKFLRSKDGVTWEEVPAPQGLTAHPVRHIAFGYVDPSTSCPLAPSSN